MSLAFLFHYLMLNLFRVLINPSSGACDLFVELFRGLYCSGLMHAGVNVVVSLGWCGILKQAEALTEHQHTSNQSNTTHEITQQISRKRLRMDVLTFRNMLSIK